MKPNICDTFIRQPKHTKYVQKWPCVVNKQNTHYHFCPHNIKKMNMVNGSVLWRLPGQRLSSSMACNGPKYFQKSIFWSLIFMLLSCHRKQVSKELQTKNQRKWHTAILCSNHIFGTFQSPLRTKVPQLKDNNVDRVHDDTQHKTG